MLMPAALFICPIAIAAVEAGPVVPKLIFSGRALASAIRSARVWYGSLASMMSATGGPSTIQPI